MKKETIERMLNEAQKGCSVRLLSTEDAIAAINKAEAAVATIPPMLRHMVSLEFIPYSVAKAYGHDASGTGVFASFNQRGKATNIVLTRATVSNIPKTRLVMNYGKARELAENELGLEFPTPAYRLAIELIRHAAGMNPQLTRKIE